MMKTQKELVLEYFKQHPSKDTEHATVVDWVTEQWKKEHSKPPRDVWRAVRLLHEKGVLIKVKKGIYKYDPAKLFLKNSKILPLNKKKKYSNEITIVV